jgi:hypothetical protein
VRTPCMLRVTKWGHLNDIFNGVPMLTTLVRTLRKF